MSDPSPSAHAVSQYTASSSNLSKRHAIHAWNTHSQGWFSWVRDRLPKTGKVLEVGAGSGELWCQPDHDNAGLDLVLTDFSPAMCGDLRTVPGATVHQCDACELPFENDTFDAVVANHMLYHVDDPDRALAEFARVVRPGGEVFVALNGMDHLDELFAIGEQIGRPSIIRKVAKVTAENAASYLEKHLATISAERFPGIFEVPTSQPVLDYLESVGDGPLDGEQEKKARSIIESCIRTRGGFEIKKHMILFRGNST
jgi:ubiquinone/menaquinone biosynthesis C-methylase UbiE